MSVDDDEQPDARRLRAAAKKALDDTPHNASDARSAEVLLSELRVHQVELEMQNEALRQAQLALEESRDRYVDLYEFAPVGYLTVSADGLIAELNLTGATLLGKERGKLLHRAFISLVPEEDQGRWLTYLQRLRAGDEPGKMELALHRGDGTVFQAQLDCRRVDGDPALRAGRTRDVRIALSDITDRKRADEALRASEERSRAIAQSAHDAIISCDSVGRVVGWNSGAERMFGYAEVEVIGRSVTVLMPGRFRDRHRLGIDRVASGGDPNVIGQAVELMGLRKDGTEFPIEITLGKWESAGRTFFSGIVRDITDRKDSEREHANLQAQLQQAQKMESVGRLAGGIAHDFNNMLAVILAHTDFALEEAGQSGELRGDLGEIRTAALHSADLTRQLLAFARKQVVSRKVLHLNDALAGIVTMLRRLIGEDIELTLLPGEDLWTVHVDPSQIDQILTNLCVNARDAISGVGKLTVETGNVTLDADDCAAHAECVPGDYVRLTVRDDGCGMSEETQSHIFEPFFTTKAMGKGTGLGLATVYGIVQQNNGIIEVSSEPEHGTTFTIHLPRHQGTPPPALRNDVAALVMRGKETILLVEDETAILNALRRMLEQLGYVVLAAGTPGEAIRLAKEHAGELHLLITDVVMPEMNGRDLAKNLLSLYPKLKRVFMSGYTADVIAHQGVLDEGVHFLQKPFSRAELAAKVRQALGREQAS